jgi:hypothetical protein
VTMRWFGEPWNSWICENLPKIDTPVKEVCIWCDEPILENESGIMFANGPLAHKNCFFRQIIGSVAHIKKECSCFSPANPKDTDPEGLTKRQAADAAVALWEAMQSQKGTE